MTVKTANTDPGFGIYVHWPFCAAKCPYCDFNSHVRHQGVDQQRFIKAYLAEMRHMASLAPNRTVNSIFFGGGTPSLMVPEGVATIIDAIGDLWHLPDDAEISLEANPSSADKDRFIGYRSAGVNRLSLGVQALNDRDLRFLGRMHDVDQARSAIELARQTFPRLSFDLIYARPAQTLDAWRSELEEAISMAADHLSLYQLTIEQETPYWDLRQAGKLAVPDAEQAAELYELTQEITTHHGLPAYEISNHAKQDGECRHNLVYWRYGAYAGIGPGAHGRLSLNDGRHALATEKIPETWLAMVEAKGHGIICDELLTAEESGDEFLLMNARTNEGFDPARYCRIAGRPLKQACVDDLISHGMLMQLGNGNLRATPAGWLVLDAVVADLAA